jgi:hypothetical protein
MPKAGRIGRNGDCANIGHWPFGLTFKICAIVADDLALRMLQVVLPFAQRNFSCRNSAGREVGFEQAFRPQQAEMEGAEPSKE